MAMIVSPLMIGQEEHTIGQDEVTGLWHWRLEAACQPWRGPFSGRDDAEGAAWAMGLPCAVGPDVPPQTLWRFALECAERALARRRCCSDEDRLKKVLRDALDLRKRWLLGLVSDADMDAARLSNHQIEDRYYPYTCGSLVVAQTVMGALHPDPRKAARIASRGDRRCAWDEEFSHQQVMYTGAGESPHFRYAADAAEQACAGEQEKILVQLLRAAA